MWYRWSMKFALKIVELNSSAWLVFCVTVMQLGTHTTTKIACFSWQLKLHKVTAGCKNQPWHRRKSGSEGRRSNYWWPCSILATNSSVGVCANIRQSTCLHCMYIICTSAHLPFERLTVELLLIHIEGLGCPLVGEEKALGQTQLQCPPRWAG